MSTTLSSNDCSNARRDRDTPAVAGQCSNADAQPSTERRQPGLIAQVRRYYVDNPTEELKWVDIREKFGCSNHTARWIVRSLIDEGLLESVRVVRLRTRGIAKEIA